MAETLAALAAGLLQVLTWPAVAYLAAGVLGGYVVGLLPGIGGPVAMALMLPFAFAMDTVPAFALLMGVAAATVSAGEMTSILIGVPGEATSAAMLLDGHRMSVRGEAGRAAGAAVAASLAGGLFGAVVLGLSLPVARPLFSAIASPELLMLALLGIGLVASLAGDAPLKGIVAGLGGLFLATVGLDPSEGVPRFTFGQLFLWDGVGLLPAALGLFALPEAVALLDAGSPAVRRRTSDIGTGIRETIGHWRLVLRCSLLGTGVGVLPGVGATVSQWLAYAQAAHGSPRRARFGTGEVEGVIGPAAASNATLGGDLIPTLALGIPGSVPTAILLGALTLKGVTPGPALLLPDGPGGGLALVFAFVWMIAIGNALAAAVSLLCLDRLGAIARVPGTLLFPVVMALIPLGAYAERHAAGDLVLVAVLGVVGWLMARDGWPRAPMLLGLVLGPMIEQRFLLAQRAYGAAWVLRPGVLVLAAIALVIIWRSRRTVGATAPRAMDRDTPSALLVAAACAAGLVAAMPLSGAPAVLPRLVLSAALAFSLLLASASRCRAGAGASPEPAKAAPPDTAPAVSSAALAWSAVFLLGPLVAGFPAAAGISCTAFLRLRAGVSWGGSLLAAGSVTALMLLVREYALQGAGPGWW